MKSRDGKEYYQRGKKVRGNAVRHEIKGVVRKGLKTEGNLATCP